MLALHPGYGGLLSLARRALRLATATSATHASQNAAIARSVNLVQAPPAAKIQFTSASARPATERQAAAAKMLIVTPTLPSDVRGGRYAECATISTGAIQ